MSETVNRRASLAFTAVALLLAGHYWIWGGEYDLGDVNQLKSDRADLAGRLDSLSVVLDSVTAWADSLETDPVVIERVARERHSFIRPGERLYLFVDEPQP
ncbi:MAG: septum formation initiator family protein [Gemmatimonadota bacterium]